MARIHTSNMRLPVLGPFQRQVMLRTVSLITSNQSRLMAGRALPTNTACGNYEQSGQVYILILFPAAIQFPTCGRLVRCVGRALPTKAVLPIELVSIAAAMTPS